MIQSMSVLDKKEDTRRQRILTANTVLCHM